MRADSGFYTHSVVSVCCKLDVRASTNLIEAIPEADWTPIPYWMDGAADVAETTYTWPLQSEPDAAPVRLGGWPTPSLANWPSRHRSYHGFITGDGETLELEADHRLPCRGRNAIRT